MSRFERYLLWFWSGIFALIAGLFFILSFLSRDRIYEANLEYKDSNIIESNFVEYGAKIKFKNQLFRAQKDLSDIEIMDFKFADSNILNTNNNGGGGNSTPRF